MTCARDINKHQTNEQTPTALCRLLLTHVVMHEVLFPVCFHLFSDRRERNVERPKPVADIIVRPIFLLGHLFLSCFFAAEFVFS